jgi:Tfp pilus assembly protein PilN
MKLRLNLSTSPRENKRPFLAAAVAIGGVALIAFVILSHSAYVSWQANRAFRADISHWESEIRTDQQKRQALEIYFHTPESQQILERSAFLNSLIGERSFPWTKIFMDLEQTLPPGVRVISISPKLQNGRAQVALKVGALDDASKIKFLEAMEKSKTFSGMELKSDSSTEQATSADRITLELTVWYEIS